MPGNPVVLDTFGGIVATSRPEDLPEGASPRCNDVDFVVGRFIQRPGEQSVYTNTLSGFGPEAPGTATDVDTESAPWTNVNNILLNDGSFATRALSGAQAVQSVTITQGGYYALSETVTVSFSGTGTPATGTAVTATVTPPSGPSYKKVTGVTITGGGSYTSAVTASFTGAASPTNNATGTVVLAPSGQTSDNIRLLNFTFSIPSNYQVKGIKVSVKGFASNATLYGQLVKAGANVGNINSVALPTTNNFVNLGSDTDLWGTTWTYTDVDSPNFGIEIWVSSPAVLTASLDYAEISIYGTPTNADTAGIANANLDETDQTTVVLDGEGLHWIEDVTNAPNQLSLSSIIPAVPAGTKMKGIDADGKVYLAYSNFTEGVSQPMQYNGSWCDRITQVGPGQAPVFTPIQASGTTFPITSITQPAAKSDYNNPGTLNELLQSAGPSSTAPGNVLTVFYSLSYDPGVGPQPAAEDTLLDGTFNAGIPVYVHLSGTASWDGTYLVTGIGNAIPPGGGYYRYYFTVQTNTTAYLKSSGHAGTYQMTLATLTATNPVPGLVVGNDATVSGASVPAWDASWPVIQALNSGEMTITQTSVTSGVATYSYSLVSGTAPAAGELVTVTNTTNAGGALNVVNATIVSATGGGTGTFTVSVPAPDAAATPESGQATTAGTKFTIDPGPQDVGTVTNPILGNSTGGTLTFASAAAQQITAGIKQASVFFITRNGAVTRPAPPVEVTIPSNTGSIAVSQIPVGPPDVVARGITFTESGQNGVKGASFYYYDTPVSYTVNGTSYTSDALIVPNNTDTTATFTFSDTVLLASDEIDVPGNNYFNLIELGDPVWMFQYADRMMYGLCRTKIQNMLNMSFDGGYLPTLSAALPMPTGWSSVSPTASGSYTITAFSITSNEVTFQSVNSLQPGYNVLVTGLSTGTYLNNVPLVVDTATGTTFTASFAHADVTLTSDAGNVITTDSPVGLVTSLDFGNAFRITNYSGTAWTQAQLLFQTAYQDYLGVNIIQPNTPYSVRVKARSLNADAQVLTLQLVSYASGSFGIVTSQVELTFNQGIYAEQSAVLIGGSGLAVVPTPLQFAIGISSLAAGAGIEIDRVDIYPTNRPVDTTTIWTSYANKFESVDGVTGSLGVGADNPQPAQGSFVILEQLYIEKTASLCVTQDSPNYEPNNWQVRLTNDRAGSVGPNAFDEGEEFSLSASRNGIYYFDGGKPMPISRELQSSGSALDMWEYINWNAGSTIWLRNDLNRRRLLLGIPMNLPNPWLPNASAATPTAPNVILMCNYTGCPTGEELAMSGEVHVTMFGDLKALDMRRKWSLWQIVCPVAEFVPRQDGLSAPLFLGNGIASSKIYQLVAGAASGGQNTDDGAAINWSYTTYGFTKAKQGQQVGLGALRKVWYYLAATMEGVGQVAGKLYSNSLGALTRNTFTIPLPFTLSYPQQNDQERVLEIGGQRVFVEFSSIGTGGYAEIGPVILDGEVDKNSPHRGVAS